MARTKVAPVRSPLSRRKTVEEEVSKQILDYVKKRKIGEDLGMQHEVVGKGKATQNAQLDAGKGTITDAVMELKGKTTGVISQPKQARVVSSEENKESQSLWTNVRHCRQRREGKFDLSSQKERWDELVAKMTEMGQETFGKITWLQSELKAARIAMHAAKTEFDIKLANMEKELGSVDGDRDATLEVLAQELSKAKFERDKNLVLENALMALRHRKGNVDRHLVVMWEKLQNLTKSEQACKTELEQAIKKKVEVEDELASMSFDKQRLDLCLETTLHLETTLQEVEDEKEKIVKENVTLTDELVSTREEKNQLASSLEMTRRKLEEEKGKTLCQICLESQKDVICFPCLHLRCCFICLENHRKLNNTCPSCMTNISGVLLCNIGNK